MKRVIPQSVKLCLTSFSFFDGEQIKKHLSYLGKRVKRGLFKTSKGITLNADINAGYNILKKAVPESLSFDILSKFRLKGIEALSVMPICLTPALS